MRALFLLVLVTACAAPPRRSWDTEWVPVASATAEHVGAIIHVYELLDEAGITAIGVSMAGAETASVPARDADRARRILRAELDAPRAPQPFGSPYERPAHLMYRVVGER